MRHAIILLLLAVLASPAMGDMRSDLLNQQNAGMGQLELSSGTIYFPWSEQENSAARPSSCGVMPTCCPTKVNVFMEGARSQEQVSDLKALNTVKERNIIYDEAQTQVSGEGAGNSMEISVTGKEESYKGMDFGGDCGDFGIENRIDEVLTSDPSSRSSRSSFGPQDQRNYMDIDVSGITVTAINTVPDGSAVATSNIIIKPVQIIESPSEAAEKLR
ncbi:MAG: hypothetical protein HPY61_05645 [Methanotrichaceae archaeon]|nr:hypothetical protein [Methanotrichaceae archaeon]